MISTTLDANSGRVLVVYHDNSQPYAVCIKDAADWQEIHDYIINENNIDDIPNRKIDCTSEMKCSPKRSVYEMSPAEAEILRNHSKVEWVERSSLYNEYELEQRKYDEEFDGQNKFLKIVKDITSKGFVRNNYKKNLVDLSDIKINLKGKK